VPEAVIVSALRTPIGTAMKGTLRDTDAYQLADHIVGATMAELDPHIDRSDIDDLILGEGLYGGGVVARHAAVTAGLTSVPGLAVNRHCAAGLAAVQGAAASIRAGMDRLVIAGGVNSASTSPRFKRRAGEELVDWFPPTHPDSPEAPNMDMSITVGWNAAVKAGVSREEMDAWALRSHRNAIAAIDEGRFKHEIVPIDTPYGLFDTDEHPRRDTTLEKLASLKPLHPEIEGFSITAGNACGANDAAAALAIASDSLGLPALGTVLSWASVGVDPAVTGLAPVEAIPKALARAGLSLADVDLFEINEAFAAMCVATIKLLEIDPELVNVSGSGCSLGHPVAATGARMLVTLTHELRRRGGGIGVAAMCAGGGMGSATVISVTGGSAPLTVVAGGSAPLAEVAGGSAPLAEVAGGSAPLTEVAAP
jgi:acetyl-CoA C-acetyltransferase